jgi:hypothetical protein
MRRILYALLAMGLFVTLMAAAVQAQMPMLPHAFYGAVSMDGQPASVGTQIEARGEGVTLGVPGNPLTTTAVGLYGGAQVFDAKLVAQGDVQEGAAIQFYVDGILAECALPGGPWLTSYPFQAGGITELNLRASGSSSEATIAGQVLLQGRTDHSGVRLLDNGQELATTGADGHFTFASPVPVGQSLALRAEKTGYLYAQRTVAVTAPGTLTLPTVTLPGGDILGPAVQVTKPGSCPEPHQLTIAGPPDGTVNIFDLTFVAARYERHGPPNASPDWEPTPDGCHPDYMAYRADMNEDDVVDIRDVVLVGANFNEQAPIPWP